MTGTSMVVLLIEYFKPLMLLALIGSIVGLSQFNGGKPLLAASSLRRGRQRRAQAQR